MCQREIAGRGIVAVLTRERADELWLCQRERVGSGSVAVSVIEWTEEVWLCQRESGQRNCGCVSER